MGARGVVVNIIVFWNTICIDPVLTQLRQKGHPKRDGDVARLSPFVHERHINLLGRYSFAVPMLLEASCGHCINPTTQMLNRILRSIAP